ncbi:MAG: tol-pal system protein YbgF [Desulfovibrio sp.]
MKGKMFFLGFFAILMGGCIPTTQNSAGHSLEWRVQSLEESFLNIKETQRDQMERQVAFEQFVTSRLSEVEDKLGIEPAMTTPRLGMGDMPAPMGAKGDVNKGVAQLENQIVLGADIPDTPLMQNAQSGTGLPMPVMASKKSAATKNAITPWAVLPQGAVNKHYPAEAPQSPFLSATKTMQSAPQGAVVTEITAPPASSMKSVKKSTPVVTKSPKKAMASKKSKPQKTSATAQRLYEHALSQILTGNNYEGRTALKKFLRENPSSKLAPNAMYWLGESYYSEKNYGKAILTFKEVTSKYPNHAKSADALLKIGMSYQKMGDADNASFYLRVLADDFPKTKAAGQARSILRTLSS